MAHMFPENGPVPGAPYSERLLYDLFRTQLSDDFRVFHSVPWPEKPARNRRPTDVEIDFIVVHPRRGVLVLEVKGGTIRRDGPKGTWYTRNRDGEEPISDPVQQARNAMYALRTLLDKALGKKGSKRRYGLARGVWFPQCRWPAPPVPTPVVEPTLILDSDDLGHVEQALHRLYDSWEAPPADSNDQLLTEDMLRTIDAALAPTIFGQSPLAIQVGVESTQFFVLTEDQRAYLRDMERYHRLLIPGAAGTGKTVLALEAAWKLAAQGDDVLFLCWNGFLAKSIAHKIQRDPRQDKPAFEVHAVRTLAIEAAEKAGDARLVAEAKKSRSDQVYARVLTAALDQLARRGTPWTFDTILVDEAQDITKECWRPITDQLLKDRDESRLYLFFDEDQREEPGEWLLPFRGDKTVLPLHDNLRNTQHIFRDMVALHPTLAGVRCRGPEGRPTRYFSPQEYLPQADGSAEVAEVHALNAALDWLVQEGGIAPEHILVISCRSQESTIWNQHPTVGAYDLTWDSPAFKPGHVALNTVQMAKGLERQVVILSELEALQADRQRRLKLYRAASRAMHQLVVLGAPDQYTG